MPFDRRKPKYPGGQGTRTEGEGGYRGAGGGGVPPPPPPGGGQGGPPPPPPGGGQGVPPPPPPGGGQYGTREDLNIPREAEEPWSPYGDEYMDQYFAKVFGEGGSFDPISERMGRQTDASQREIAEMMAASGGVGGGIHAGLAGDIYGEASLAEAEKYMDFRNQQINQMQQAAAYLFQDKWQQLGFQQQKDMANLMLEIERRKAQGDDYNPDMGFAEIEFMYNSLMQGNMPPEIQAYVRGQMVDAYGEDQVAAWEANAEESDITDPFKGRWF